MIDSNLAVLLAERNLKITKVSKDTGISRTTLTALCYDHTAGIKFDTLNILCSYLDVTPAEFFNYSPYDFEDDGVLIEMVDPDDPYLKNSSAIIGFEVTIRFCRKNMSWRYSFHAFINSVEPENSSLPSWEDNCIKTITVSFIPYYDENTRENVTADDLAGVKEFKTMLRMMTLRQRKNMIEDLANQLGLIVFHNLSQMDEYAGVILKPFEWNIIDRITEGI